LKNNILKKLAIWLVVVWWWCGGGDFEAYMNFLTYFFTSLNTHQSPKNLQNNTLPRPNNTKKDKI
jgi:hypothetical protein